jgi:hypothetical protein
MSSCAGSSPAWPRNREPMLLSLFPRARPEPERRTLLVEPLLGLANRLHALLSAQRLAELSDRRLGLIWTNNYPTQAEHSDCRFEDLFQDHFPQLASFDAVPLPSVRFVSQPRYVSWQTVPVPRAIGLGFMNPAVDLDAYRHVPVLGITAFHLVGRRGESRELLLREAARRFVALRPATTVARAVAAFRDRYFNGPLVGVHIRRGDYGALMQRLNVPCPDEDDFRAYVEACLAKRPDLRVFLACDDQGVKTRFLERFGARVCTYPGLAFDRGSAGMQGALIDLLLLSHTAFVCGTPTSTYTATAAFRNLASRGSLTRCLAELPGGVRHQPARLAAFVGTTLAGLDPGVGGVWS